MKALVLYDSFFGNTEKIARDIGSGLDFMDDVNVVRVNDAQPDQLTKADLLIIGSPTRKFTSTAAIKKLIAGIPGKGLKNIKVTAFDTRMDPVDVDSRILDFFVKIFGYAAEPLAKKLQKKGGELILPAEGFIVTGEKGPLREGERERAKTWARQMKTTL